MNDLVLGGEHVKSGGKFHHRRKLCQVLTPPPTARKLNFPPWQFLSCPTPPPHSYLSQLSLKKKIPSWSKSHSHDGFLIHDDWMSCLYVFCYTLVGTLVYSDVTSQSDLGDNRSLTNPDWRGTMPFLHISAYALSQLFFVGHFFYKWW